MEFVVGQRVWARVRSGETDATRATVTEVNDVSFTVRTDTGFAHGFGVGHPGVWAMSVLDILAEQAHGWPMNHLKVHEVERLAEIKRLVGEILREPAGELRHQFAEDVLKSLTRLCRQHGLNVEEL